MNIWKFHFRVEPFFKSTFFSLQSFTPCSLFWKYSLCGTVSHCTYFLLERYTPFKKEKLRAVKIFVTKCGYDRHF